MQIGQYRLGDSIGAGGMGTVFRAIDSAGKEVALKIIGPQAQVNATVLAGGAPNNVPALDLGRRMGLVREARLAMGLDHPNIVRVFDYYQHEGLLYIVMEFLNGRPLDRVIPLRGAIPLPERIGLIRQLCEALEYAHRRSVVHRDIKPSNCYVLHNGRLKVLDFGIAASTDQLPSQIKLAGTPQYMAPELFTPIPRYTEKVDIWAAGVTLYQLITGRLPFIGRSYPELQANIALQPFPVLHESLPFAQELGIIFDRALAKDPAQRYSTAAEFAYELSLLERAPETEGVSPKSAKTADECLWWATRVVPETAVTSPLPNPAAGTISMISGEIRARRRGHMLRFAEYNLKVLPWVIAGVLSAGLYALKLVAGWNWDLFLTLWPLGLSAYLGGLLIPVVLAGSILLGCLAFWEKLAAIPRCRRCRSIVQHRSSVTAFAYSKISWRHASSDCLAALQENLWDDAPKLLSMHGELVAPELGKKTSYPPLRVHLDFYACNGCEDQMAILTTEDRIGTNWKTRDEYEGACKTSGRQANRRPVIARLTGALKAIQIAAVAAAEPISPIFAVILIGLGSFLAIYYYPQFPVVLGLPGYRASITIQTNPPGQPVTVDGRRVQTHHTFAWVAGSTHKVDFNRRIHVNGKAYITQGMTSPSGLGVPYNGVIEIDMTKDRWGRFTRPSYDLDYTVSYVAIDENDLPYDTPKAIRDLLAARSNPLAHGGSNSTAIGHAAPQGVPTIVVTSRPPGLAVVVDGVRVVTPMSYHWQVGSYHTLEVPAERQTMNPGGTLPLDAYANGAWDFGSKEGSDRVHIDWSAHPFPTTYTARFRRVPVPETGANQASAPKR